MRRLTNWSARHPGRVLAVWGVAVLVGIGLTCRRVGDLTTDSRVTNKPESHATPIRSVVLLPASMKLLGNANWYLPSWLNWLPDLHVERG